MKETTPFLSSRNFLLLIAGYYLIQLVIRLMVSPCVDLDEAEQVMLTQQLSLGYGSQPPLYTWIQWGIFKLLGESVLSLSLFKNALLFGTCLLTYHCARWLTRSVEGGMLAVLALFYIPQMFWESQRDLTHTVLASFFSVATLYCFLLILDQRKTSGFVWLGICAGLGILAKYNYLFWLLGLLAGSLVLPACRAVIFERRLALTLGVALLLFLPHGLWMRSHHDMVLMTASKFDVHSSLPFAQAAGEGLVNLLMSYLEFLVLMILICVVVFWSGRDRSHDVEYAARVLWLAAGFFSVFVLLLAVMMVFKVTGSRGRWLQPLLIAAPVLVAGICHDRLTSGRLKIMALFTGMVMLATLVALPGRLFAAERLHRNETITKPYEKLAVDLRSHIPSSTRIVAATTVLAGNLHLAMPDRSVMTPELAGLFQDPSEHCVLVWEVTKKTRPPDALLLWAQTQTNQRIEVTNAIYLSDLYRYHKKRQLQMGMLQIY